MKMSLRPRAASVIAVLSASLALSVPAHAQSEVEAHLQRGVALRREGRDVEAVVEFESAHRIAPSPRTAGQLGLALQASGDWVRGYEMLREATGARGDGWVERNRAALETALHVAEEHVGTVDVRGNIEGAQVLLDDRVQGELPLARPITVLIGAHRLTVRRAGFATVERSVQVRPGELSRESIVLEPSQGALGPSPGDAIPQAREPFAATSAASPGADPPWPWFTVGLAGAIVGGVAAGGGGVALLQRNTAAMRYNDSCFAGLLVESASCAGLRSQVGTFEAASFGLFITGGILAATGIVLMVLPRPTGARPRATVSWSPGGGMTFQTAF
jgi:hypothetical protein